jgi:hypothetical protein
MLSLLAPAARAEVPFDPPGTYYTSWLGNTYMDADRHKNVTEELADLCLSPNGRIFTAGYAESWGGGAEYRADDGGFIARYDRFESRTPDIPGVEMSAFFVMTAPGSRRPGATLSLERPLFFG